MGDSIADNWEGADELNLEKKVNSDDEYESLDGENENALLNRKETVLDVGKSEGKKRKLTALRELKKKKKLAATSNISEHDTPESLQLNPSEMFEEIENLRISLGRKSAVIFSSNNFFSPVFDYPQTKSKSKPPSLFTRALAVGLPAYKKLLHSDDTPRGSPTVLIICASALRATQIIKSISAKIIRCKIAKLFAKHIKISEQVEMLAADSFPIAIGTPNRLIKLLELGSLDLKSTKIVLIDKTPDIKNMTILTLNGVREDFCTLLDTHIAKALDHIKLAFVRDENN